MRRRGLAASFLGSLAEPHEAGPAHEVAAPQPTPSSSSGSSVRQAVTHLVQVTPPVVLVPLHALSIVICAPGHLAIELGEGCLFGFQKGLALALSGKALGAVAAFGAGRGAMMVESVREWVMKKFDSWPSAKQVAAEVEQGGAFSVFLIRIAPVPCAIKNYSLALLTDIPFMTFLPATLLGLAPTTAAHVYAGTLVPSAAELASGHGTAAAMQVVAAAGVAASAGLLSLLAGYCLSRRLGAEPPREAGEAEGEELQQLKC